MSYKVTAAVWKRYRRGGSEKLLALALAKYSQDDGTRIFPSVATLAAETVQSERTVQTQLKTMRDGGWLIVTARPNGGRKPTEYQINPAWLRGAEAAPLAVQELHPSEEASGAEAAPQGCKSTSSGVQISHPRGEAAAAPDKSLKRSLGVNEVVKPISHKGASKKAPKRKRPFPEGFTISERVEQWAYDKGFVLLDERLEHFRAASLANDYAYADWDAAFMNAIRGDWAKLKAPTPAEVLAERRAAEHRQAEYDEQLRRNAERDADINWQTSPERVERKARSLGIDDPTAWSSPDLLRESCVQRIDEDRAKRRADIAALAARHSPQRRHA